MTPSRGNVFDATGLRRKNIVGGVRLPPLDVPSATYLGTQCALLGATEPFCDAQLELLYPTHAHYVSQMQAAVDQALADGVLLPEDADELMFRAARSQIGDLDETLCGARVDFDEDGLLNPADNCPVHANPGQEDGDGDGRGDACDNCIFVANPGQEDDGGIATSDPDGIGNACQCGDVTGNGIVNGQDANAIKRHSLGIEPNPSFAVPGNCDVSGNGACNHQDANAVRREALGLASPLFGQNCHNAIGAPVPPDL